MAEAKQQQAKSNADLDLREVSRDADNSTYRQAQSPEGDGPRVEQVLGKPTAAKD